MGKIFLDTNFLMDSIRFKVSLEEIHSFLQEPIELFILSSTLKELEKIAKNRGKTGSLAKLALETVKNKKIKVLKTEESPDKVFLSIADKNTIIATNDSSLRKKLKKLGIKTIYLRGKKYFGVG